MTGFQSKREAAAEKLQEARQIAQEYGTLDSQVDNGNLYFALRKCLEHIDAQPPLPVQPAQEPFGYFKAEPFGWTDCAETDEGAKALYEAPPKRTWVGLTDEEIHGTPWYNETRETYQFALALIAKLKERNS